MTKICDECGARYEAAYDCECEFCGGTTWIMPQTVSVAVVLEIKASDEHEAWKIVDRILNRDGDEELVAYTDHQQRRQLRFEVEDSGVSVPVAREP